MHNSKIWSRIGLAVGLAAMGTAGAVQMAQANHVALSGIGIAALFLAALGKALGADSDTVAK